MNDEELDRLVRQLPSRVAPQRDLWPELEARLQSRSSSSHSWFGRVQAKVRDAWSPENALRWMTIGASGLVATLVLMVLSSDRLDSEVTHSEVSNGRHPMEAGAELGIEKIHRRSEEIKIRDLQSTEKLLGTWVNEDIGIAGTQWGKTGMEEPLVAMFGDHQVAISLLEKVFFDKRKAMDPKLAELFRVRVEIVDQAIEQSQLAFASNSNDLSLVDYVHDAYQSKLELLDWANSLED